jgi:integrase
VEESSVGKHSSTILDSHIAAYLDHLKAKGTTQKHQDTVRNHLQRLAADCGWKRLGNLNRRGLEKCLANQTELDMAARTRNSYRCSAVSFANWAVKNNRMTNNPFTAIAKASEKADRRKQRRALSLEELQKLLHAARLRPIAEFGREKVELPLSERKGRRTWQLAPLTWETLEKTAERGEVALAKNPALIRKLKRRGRNRSLIYKFLTFTGLRRNELTTLAVGHVHLDDIMPFVEILAKNEKARRGASVPLHKDLVMDLRAFLSERLEEYRQQILAEGVAFNKGLPMKLPPAMPLFEYIPTLETFDLDLNAAGIEKQDELGRTVDMHALRTTFGTYLSKAGVAPRTAQEALRHSTIELTMGSYTDPKLLDVAGAINRLPNLPLTDPQESKAVRTGTDDTRLCGAEIGAVFGAERQENGVKRSSSLAIGKANFDRSEVTQTLVNVQHKTPLPIPDKRGLKRARQDSNLQPSDSKSATLSN